MSSTTMTRPTVPRPDPGTATGAEHVETVVAGGGQAGLATARHLGRLGRPCLVLDAHPRVGDSWRERYASLRLVTPARYDSLPGLEFPAPPGSFPSGADMAAYLERYAERFRLPVRPGTLVTRVEHVPRAGFRLSTTAGAVTAHQVVVATGGGQVPRVPWFAADLDAGIRQLHSSAYRGPGQLLPGAVLVVGAGQSGVEIALELAGAGVETWLSGRPSGEIPFPLTSGRGRAARPLLWFTARHLLNDHTSGGRRLRDRVRQGGAPLVGVRRSDLAAAGVRHVDSRTVGTRDGLPVLADGAALRVRNVLWCTGFRPDFGFIHPAVTGADGWPRDDGGIVRTSPGLYFVGLPYQRGYASTLVGGVGRDAARVARHIAVRSRQRERGPAVTG
ncbi:MAG TPA: NAD(P)-binding domain-containing protein [Segeticoccus sp.]|nr:NAD(P)-binding domain-containing protein [Segeticoccus sp.]